MVAKGRGDAGLSSTALDHGPGVGGLQCPFGELAGLAASGAEQRRIALLANAGGVEPGLRYSTS
jgi:hypothetical protein